MKTVKTAREARAEIRKGTKAFEMKISPTAELKALYARYAGPQGIVLETGETIVLTTLVVVVGAVVAYAIYKGYQVRLKGKGYELRFTKR